MADLCHRNFLQLQGQYAECVHQQQQQQQQQLALSAVDRYTERKR